MTEWQEVSKNISNWGRWGAEDQLGTLNHITPEKLASLGSLIKAGRTISLSLPLDGDGPQGAHGVRRNPIHLMSLDGSDSDIAERLGSWGGKKHAETAGFFGAGPMRFNDDFLITPTQASTQWDALSHVYYDETLYNGFPSTAVTSLGATRDAIDPVASSGNVVTRGVLLDVARHQGVKRLAPGTIITPADLDAVAASQGVTVGQGDVVVIRTGWLTAFQEGMPSDEWWAGNPGVSWRVAEWLWERDIAAIAADNLCVEVLTPEAGVVLLFHMLALRDMGLMLGELWDLEELSEDCAGDGVYEFLLTAAPLRITGGVGSPVNPIAIK